MTSLSRRRTGGILVSLAPVLTAAVLVSLPMVTQAAEPPPPPTESGPASGDLEVEIKNKGLGKEVSENPRELIVYGGAGKAARNWEAYAAIVRELTALEGDQTLLVQSGKPVGVLTTHKFAPRVLIANSNLVGHWATWEEFRRLEALGLI